MSKVLVLCGKKQSGKSSTAKFLYGREMVRLGLIETFNFNENGDLLIPTEKTETGWGIFNIYDKSYDFVQSARHHIWPHIKVYSFADKLKLACHHIFGLPIDLMYGSDEDKATKTNIRNLEETELIADMSNFDRVTSPSEDMKFVPNPNAYYAVRKILQDFGTKVREIDPDAWVDRVYEQILEEQSFLSVIDDCRYPNELAKVDKLDAITIKFTRQLDTSIIDTHSSETSFDDLPDDSFDFVVDNVDMTLNEKHEAIEDILLDIGFLQ